MSKVPLYRRAAKHGEPCEYLGAYRGTSPTRTGSHKNEAFLELFLFLFSMTYHRSFFENVLRNKNVPPTVFPAFLKSRKNRPQIAYPPGEWS